MIMKRIVFLVSIIIITATVFSCKKMLDPKPVNAVSDENPIFDLTSSQTALRGVYRALGNTGYYGESWVTLGFFPSGDIKNLTTGGASNLVTVNYRSDDVNFSTTWNAIYMTINRANNVIAKVPAVTDPLLTTALKNQYVGEAKFIRALCYFDLARGWGGVQLVLEPTGSLTNIPARSRSSLEDTYTQILKDLADAESLLNPTAALNKIRVTKETVWALRARVHLYKQEWALADEYATKLIAPGKYILVKPFNAWFANGITASDESIFELEFSPQNPSTIRAQMQHPTNNGTYRYAPTDAFVEILRTPAIAGGRRALIDSATQKGITQWFGNLYYRSTATDPAYILRIAEMYLIRAEARAHTGDLSGSLDDLNEIRKRADVPLSASATEEDLLLDIENERRLEFFLEPHRWFDLVRTGRAKVVLEGLSSATKVDSWENVFPIPNLQIQLDKNLIQNPGY
ncbi:RagB/SusD domain-containing protein [Cytophaga hutchinsonii ATCC 33406]|uniref:RagB/SusD domain-containing protein n=2 Tax=Cytophaga hutchinsonii TaxID=985 RepID=A0A6N4SNH4_CYTH3|nr:RagB/SusD domain-containing protein [Cytophaga hutchinsonii ATCC 33406]SFX07085.1 RagB/SusD domain-containing protein [Cytophaga hutchinsonii ATCC 33406]